MQEIYVYLVFISLPFLIGTLVIFVMRPDLRRYILKVGILGGIAGILSELWYLQDYWRPPMLLGTGHPSVEDFLFGFGVVAFTATLHKVIFRSSPPVRKAGARRRGVILLISALLALLILTSLIGINSIVTSYLTFAGIAIYVLIQKPSFIKRAFITSGIVALIAFVTYSGIHLVAPTYFADYFMLSSQPAGLIIFNLMPVTELIWFVLWGLAGTAVFDYIREGKQVDSLQQHP